MNEERQQSKTQAGFKVLVNGSIESANPSGASSAYCKYTLVAGNERTREDWQLEEGSAEGVTQLACRSGSTLVFNFPFDAAFHSTSPHGWPQLVLSFYGPDFLGRDVAKGFGRMFLPIAPGRYTHTVQLFKPLSSSVMNQLYGILSGQRPEFIDPAFIARSEGREVTRVQSCGTATVRINMLTRDLALAGYSEEAGPQGKAVHHLVSILRYLLQPHETKAAQEQTIICMYLVRAPGSQTFDITAVPNAVEKGKNMRKAKGDRDRDRSQHFPRSAESVTNAMMQLLKNHLPREKPT